MILISFPHNPTTQCVDLDFFREIVRLAARHGTMVVHDFAYADLGFDGYSRPASCKWKAPRRSRSRSISMSKSYNMAGWRVGFCLGNREDDRGAGAHQELSGLRRFSADPDRFHHRAARMRGRYEEDLRDIPEAARCAGGRAESRGLAGGAAAGLDVRVGADSGALRALGSLEFSKLLMEKALVAVSPGIGFGPMGEGYVRFALIENQHRTRQATKSIQQFLKKG